MLLSSMPLSSMPLEEGPPCISRAPTAAIAKTVILRILFAHISILMKLHLKVTATTETTLVELLTSQCELSKSAIKKALNFGGGWLKVGGKGAPQRCRRATKALRPGDAVEFYFDDQLYSTTPPAAAPIRVNRHWGIWYKPANVVAQGTPYGDQGCMEQQVQQLSGQKQVFLLHRLDREAAGLMMFAYHRQAAAQLNALWRSGAVSKIYQAEIHGHPTTTGLIDEPLDGKAATTRFEVVTAKSASAVVRIQLETGRFHQIRRHFAQLGHPLIGDPRYGLGGDKQPLQLVASELHFQCPYDHQKYSVTLPAELRLF